MSKHNPWSATEYFGLPSAQADAEATAARFQYMARLRSANARDIKRFGVMRCAQMQREAAEMYAAARSALVKASKEAQ